MTDKRLVFTTCGSREEAQRIAREIVERRLAACVNIVPQIESVYRWQDKVDSVDCGFNGVKGLWALGSGLWRSTLASILVWVLVTGYWVLDAVH